MMACTSNWPQFRGPETNMVVNGKNLPEEWAMDKNIRWSADLTGIGWSSPIVWGDKVFITSAFAEKSVSGGGLGIWQMRPPQPPAQQGNQPKAAPTPPPPPPPQPAEDKSYLQDTFRWDLTCFDLKTGKELWKKEVRKGNPRFKVHAGSTYANETPVTDGKRIYAYFGMTGLYCFDMDGNLLWEKDPGAYFTLNGWGTGSSPVLFNNMVFVQVDNEEHSFIVAYDAITGTEKWRSDREEKTNYSTPVIWKNRIRTELVTCGKTIRSYEPETGRILWQLKVGGEMCSPSPVADTDNFYAGTPAGRETKGTLYSVKAGGTGDITPADSTSHGDFINWLVKDPGLGNSSPLLYKGLLYIVAVRGGEVRCYDTVTGKPVFREKVEGAGSVWASPWICNDKLFFMDEKGVTQILKAGDKFEVIGKNKLDDKFWASVAISKDACLIRGAKKLFCIGF